MEGRSWRVKPSSPPSPILGWTTLSFSQVADSTDFTHYPQPSLHQLYSQSPGTTAESNGESTMADNLKQGWPFLPSTALPGSHVGKQIPEHWGVYTLQLTHSEQSAASARLPSRTGGGLGPGGIKQGPWIGTIDNRLILVLYKEWWNMWHEAKCEQKMRK